MAGQVRQRAVLIAQVGALSARDAWQLTTAAEESGYDAISSTPPFYYSYTEHEVAAYYTELAERSSIPPDCPWTRDRPAAMVLPEYDPSCLEEQQ